ncbi:bifunctional arginine demethylase and lysyl-hydroxylase JMJD6-like [Belonocnema kinseyi]|uniref:bifunctional arginine demethylase and lysyl-hydroxylase JMJD6-like n=1 Tax=Belonocnema kinseyi TaxID=2817044 RepID=UPI00143D84AF|nr:bifunctional arginine demethylase and lysyl-hydroxylase JMJD6-like [Belonocnema kinseyi]
MTDRNEKLDKIQSNPIKKSLANAKKDLGLVLDKIDTTGFSVRAFRLWRAYLELRPFRVSRFWILWIFSVSAWVLYFSINNYISSIKYDRCLVEQPSLAQKFFRPAVDCSMCIDVQQVERLSNLDPITFEERFAYTGRPVVIVDGAANWTAMEKFSFSFFKDLYHRQRSNCQFFPYQTEFRNLHEVLNMSAERAQLKSGTAPWYVGWSNCDKSIGAVLREYYQRPYFLPETAESGKTDWIFMGSPGYGAPMHVDDVSNPSWQAQIRGKKLWILEPPRECHYACKRLEVTVNPGEIFVLDTNWWYHQTKIISQDMSITIGAEYD